MSKIWNPWCSEVSPKYLLDKVETDPNSFIEGRRNNDVVNWAILKIIIHYQDTGEKLDSYLDLVEEWNNLSLSDKQIISLVIEWDESVQGKIATCWRLYSEEAEGLEYKLIDQGGYSGINEDDPEFEEKEGRLCH